MPRGWTKILNREDIVDKLDYFLLKNDSLKNLQKIFCNKNPIVLDIGTGKGLFLCKISKKYQQINFLGIDGKKKRIISTVKKLNKDINSNVRLLNIYVDKQIDKLFNPNQFIMVYINYPDPWTKKRQNKKRLVNGEFLSSLAKILKKNGMVKIVTDSCEYSDIIEKSIKQSQKFDLSNEKEYLLKEQISTIFEKIQATKGFSPQIYYIKKRDN